MPLRPAFFVIPVGNLRLLHPRSRVQKATSFAALRDDRPFFAFPSPSSRPEPKAQRRDPCILPIVPTPPAQATKTRSAWLLATFFGAGSLRPGPGTYGSVAAAVLWLLAGFALHHDTRLLGFATLAATALITALGIPAATRVAREAGREDPGFVVVDEVAGQWVALLFVAPLWTHALVAVLFFRFFDILKPWPIRRFEALPEGTGIMADDLVAGVFALACTHLVLHFIPHLG